jgi:hypothetical protein
MLNRLAAGPGWELPSHQDLVPSRSWCRARTGPGALIPQRSGPISSHKKIFGPIPQECDPVLVLSHLISWKSGLISQRHDPILVLSDPIPWKCDLISSWSHENVVPSRSRPGLGPGWDETGPEILIPHYQFSTILNVEERLQFKSLFIYLKSFYFCASVSFFLCIKTNVFVRLQCL